MKMVHLIRLPAVKPPEEKPKVIQKPSIRYIHDDPLQTEVRELLKDYPSWGEAVLQERAEAN